MNTKRIINISLYISAIVVIITAGVLAWKLIPGLFTQAHIASPDYWPTQGWKTATPEEHGIDSEKLADGLMAIRERNIQVHSLMIIQDGYVVLDTTFYPYDGQTVHDVASVTKSVMTTLIGIAIDQDKLTVEDKMVSFFPNHTIGNLDASKSGITVGHLASMSSGLDCTAEGDERTLQEMMASPDYVQFILDRQVNWAPGEQFVYCSPAIHLLSPILQQATGVPALDFARQYLFEPLGIKDAMWEQDPQGYYDGWGDLSLRTQDMAKIGFLILHNGQWDETQVVSREWVGQATKQQILISSEGEAYGYGWWMDPAVESAYRADGRGGQYIFVLPEWDMVIVTTGGGFTMDDIAQYLLASFVDLGNPISANPEGSERLNAAIQAVIQPPETSPVAQLPEMAKQISGNVYVFEPNSAQILSIEIQFDGSAIAKASAEVDGQSMNSFEIGLDGIYRFSPGYDGRPAAYRGSWIDAQTFFLEYDGITNNDHAFFKFHYKGDQVEVSVSETSHEIGAQFVGQLLRP